MKDIKILIYNIITDDATFKTLTGASSGNKRLYQHFPQKKPDESNPWVTYFFTTAGLPSPQTGDVQVPDIVFISDIWGIDSDAVEDVFTRIKALLDRQELNPTNHRIVNTRLDGFNDLVEIRPNLATIYHKNCRFVMTEVLET